MTMKEYAITLLDETPKKDTPVYVIKPDMNAVAQRRVKQTGMGVTIWMRPRPWVAWERVEDIEPNG